MDEHSVHGWFALKELLTKKPLVNALKIICCKLASHYTKRSVHIGLLLHFRGHRYVIYISLYLYNIKVTQQVVTMHRGMSVLRKRLFSCQRAKLHKKS